MLFRKELIEFFDFRILVMCSPQVILERAKVRDLAHFGDMKTLLEKYQKRFIPGQKNTFRRTNPLRLRISSFSTTTPISRTFLYRTERKNDFSLDRTVWISLDGGAFSSALLIPLQAPTKL